MADAISVRLVRIIWHNVDQRKILIIGIKLEVSEPQTAVHVSQPSK